MKAFDEIIHFQKNEIIFQSKASTEKWKTVLILTILEISQTMASNFRETHVHFSQKHFMKYLCFQKTVIFFQSKASTEKRNTVLAIEIL